MYYNPHTIFTTEIMEQGDKVLFYEESDKNIKNANGNTIYKYLISKEFAKKGYPYNNDYVLHGYASDIKDNIKRYVYGIREVLTVSTTNKKDVNGMPLYKIKISTEKRSKPPKIETKINGQIVEIIR